MDTPDPQPASGGPLAGAIRGLRRRVVIGSFCEALALAVPLLLFVAGVWILVARFLLGEPLGVALGGLAVVALALPFAVWRTLRSLPDDAQLVAELDHFSGGTGVLVTQYEVGDERWVPQAVRVSHALRLPALEPRVGNGLWGSLFAVLFIGSSLWFAPPAPAADLPRVLLDSALERLADKVDGLDAIGALSPEQLEELTERLAELGTNLDAGSLEQAFESLDRFQDELGRLGTENAELLAGLRALASELGSNTEVQAELERMLADPSTSRLLESALRELGASGGLSFDPQELGAELAALAADGRLDAFRGELSQALVQRMGNLAGKGLVDPAALRELLNRRLSLAPPSTRPAKHSADCDVHNGGLCNGSECDIPGSLSGKPGAGGITRGPGAAELTIGEGSELDAELFEAQALEGLQQPDASTLLGTELGAPEVEAAGEAAGLSAIDTSGAATGSVTWKRRLSPTQRDAVRRFFNPGSDQ